MKKKDVKKSRRNLYYLVLLILIFLLTLVLGAYNVRNSVGENGLSSVSFIEEVDSLLFDLGLSFEETKVSDTVYILIILALFILIFLMIFLIIQERKSHGVIGR